MRVVRGVLIFIGTCLLLINFPLYSEESAFNRFAGGFNVNSSGGDFGLGFNLTTPYFLNSKVAFRLRSNVAWHSRIKNNNTELWTPYYSISLGVLSKADIVKDRIRVYGEGGVVVYIAPSILASSKYNVGGYGDFGFEFLKSIFGFFIEAGGISGFPGDNLIVEESISNGFFVSTGCRVYF